MTVPSDAEEEVTKMEVIKEEPEEAAEASTDASTTASQPQTSQSSNMTLPNIDYCGNRSASTVVFGKEVRVPMYVKQQIKQLRNRKRAQSLECTCEHKKGTGLPQIPSLRPSKKFVKSFYFFVSRNHMFGLHHLLLILVVVLYACIGAFIFNAIESPHEIKSVEESRVALTHAIKVAADEVRQMAEDENRTVGSVLKDVYVKMLTIEGRYAWSTFDKLEPGEHYEGTKYQWSFSSAVFFASTIFTSCGFGYIAPVTTLGKTCVVLYALVTIPLTWVVVRDCGQWFLLILTHIYAKIRFSVKKVQGYVVDENETVSLPLILSFSSMILYILLSGLFVHEYDDAHGPPGSGLSLFESCYFAFIGISMIGLGDFMPHNVSYEPLLMVIFFFGVPIVRVVNRLNYIKIENGLFGTMVALERRIHKAIGFEPKADSVDASSAKEGPASTYHTDDEEDEEEEERIRNELLKNFDFPSIATLMKSRSDVYGGDFGRVILRPEDL